MSHSDIRSLEPAILWNAFADINAIPRPSKQEARIVAFICEFAQRHDLISTVDSGGNVIITKPGTPDHKDRTPVILQAHLDMVHKAADGIDFDFENRGIEMLVDGDWVRACGTTLGADNGLGVAAILAVLASRDLSHPPLEALFTIDEEQGMSGALALQPGLLKGKTLLNLDSEEDDTFTIGCAGGIDTLISLEYPETSHPTDLPVISVEISGLRGGHSGLQIHEGRANAIKLMARILRACGEDVVALHSLQAGSARNAVPAHAIFQIVILDSCRFEIAFNSEVIAIRNEFQLIEPALQIVATSINPSSGLVKTMTADEQRNLVLALHSVVNGVYRMSPVVPGLVEASSNLSLISLANGRAEWSGLQRSSVESSKSDVSTAFAAPFILIGATVSHEAGYPGWSPSASSPILETMRAIYSKLFDQPVKVGACHAGLECGVIAKAYPDLDMISFGPNIHEAHSEEECASISSTQKFWKLLTAVLAA